MSGVMRASHSVMAIGTCGTGETGGTNVYWKLLMSEALRMALHMSCASIPAI